MLNLFEKMLEELKSVPSKWLGNIQRRDRTYKVFKYEEIFILQIEGILPLQVLRLATENGEEGYVLKLGYSPSRYLNYSLPLDIAKTAVYQFLGKKNKL